MKRGVEQLSAFDNSLMDEIISLRAWGQKDGCSSSAGVTYGFINRSSYRYDGFTIGFNPLHRSEEGQIGEAIDASASAWITLASLKRWSIWNRTPVVTPQSLSVKFCAPHEEIYTQPRINHTLSVVYAFGYDELEVISNAGSQHNMIYRPDFLMDVIASIREASVVQQITVPPNNETLQK